MAEVPSRFSRAWSEHSASDRPALAIFGHERSCPKMASAFGLQPVMCRDGTTRPAFLPGALRPRSTFRRRVLRRRDIDPHLLSTDLSGVHASRAQLPLL